MARVECGTLDNATDLYDERVDRYGSPENAIVALKSGVVGFGKA